MKLEAHGALLRDQVNGGERMERGAKVPVRGLLEIVQDHVHETHDRERALLALGFILSTASFLAGLTDSKS